MRFRSGSCGRSDGVAYLGLFGWSFLAATLVPLGSEPALVLLVRRDYPFWPLVLTATAGNYLGACTTYWLARKAAALISRRRPAAPTGNRAAAMMSSRGAPVLLLSWVPILGDALVAAAGAAGTPFLPFSVWVALGKFLRYVVVAWAAGVL
jgi:membrane protein YqaA with SNARE-associated domain